MEQYNKRPLLSICIPTYNRAEYLKGALENIIHDPAFDDDVEIVISDNASYDDTQLIGEQYASKYPNIKYFRNKENIKDANFKLTLSRGTGKYRKLSNDTLRYKSGALKIIKKTIDSHTPEYPIFFYEDCTPFSIKSTQIKSPSDFVSQSTYYIGWIATFGLWENDLDCLNVPEKYVKLQFVQIAWTFEIVKKHKNATIIRDKFYWTDDPPRKASYNLFQTHVNNLLEIYRDYSIHKFEYEQELYRNFRYYYLPLIYDYIFSKKPTSFDLSNWLKYILKDYWARPYIYPALLIKKLESKRDRRFS